MNVDDLLPQMTPWLLPEGEENDVVIASKIRLARNIAGFPFPNRLTLQSRHLIRDTVYHVADQLLPKESYYFFDTQTLASLDREFLFERRLLSPGIVESESPHAILIDKQEHFSIVINHEDHLLVESAAGGFSVQRIWDRINSIDDLFSKKLDYVFHDRYGYLTSKPARTGTGMDIQISIHIPALSATGESDKLFRSLTRNNLAIQPLRGLDSRTYNDFYFISNATTLGKSEEELINKMIDLIPQITHYERQAQNFLVKNQKELLLDRCRRALDILKNAQTITMTETMSHLSSIRLGLCTRLFDKPKISTIHSLLLHLQPAHIQKIQENSSSDGNTDRANYVRQVLEQV